MTAFNECNPICTLHGFAWCVSPLLASLLITVQTYEMRGIGGIEGNGCIDCLKAYFCTCCSLIQNEKESQLIYKEQRQNALGGGDGLVEQQYTRGTDEEMVMRRTRVTGVEEERITRSGDPVLVEGQAAIEHADMSQCQPEAGSGLHCQNINTLPREPASPTEGTTQSSITPKQDLPEQFSLLVRGLDTATEQMPTFDTPTLTQAVLQVSSSTIPT
ncbi:hypothetical protein P3342_001847 [Pyrenophora teres f. teres]|nr:hypothetical protein P3342_001847 [Pyrenophora teres f. teres]